MAKSEEFIKNLEEYAYKYIDECLENKKQFPTGSGKVVSVKDRHIPTIDYFLRIWLPRELGETISRQTWYRWLNENMDKSDTIKRIDAVFKSLAVDIVANEGKGIFYAKNRLGMHDKQQVDMNNNVQILNIDPLDDKEDNGTEKNS